MSLVRAANSGLTFATDPLGRITAELPPMQMAALDVRPHERLASTVFSQVRYWPLLIALMAGSADLAGGGRRAPAAGSRRLAFPSPLCCGIRGLSITLRVSSMAIRLHRGDLPDLSRYGREVAIDTETMGLDPHRDRLCVVQLSPGDGSADVVQIPQDASEAPNLVKLLTDPGVTKIFHYARFDIAVLKHRFGVVTGPVYCTKIASKLVRTYTDRHGLKDLVRELLNVDLTKQQQSSDWGADKLSDAQLEYAASDVLYLHDLKRHLDRMLRARGPARSWPKPASTSSRPASSSICWAGTRPTSSPIADGDGADRSRCGRARTPSTRASTRRNRLVGVLRVGVPVAGHRAARRAGRRRSTCQPRQPLRRRPHHGRPRRADRRNAAIFRRARHDGTQLSRHGAPARRPPSTAPT